MQLKKIAFTLLIGAAAAMAATSPSLAAKKKAKAEAAQPSPFCFQVQTPVCGTRGGMKMTYANACFAERDGAKVVSQGACKAAKKMSKKMSMKKKKK
ncbi:MAG: hypothetical protein ACTHLO_12850 [Pseudolabrys sp.]